MLAILALFVAFSSASQDIVIDAYRTDVLKEKERGAGAAVFVMGYRVATLVSGALALVLSDHIGWQNTYLLMAAVVVIGIISTLVGPEPEERVAPPLSLQEAVAGPLREYFSRNAAIPLLLLIVLYKLGDAYAGVLTTAFLIKGIGFSAGDVGTINKGFGFVSVIVGAMFGGSLMVRLGLFRSLLSFGILQAVSNLSFMLLAWIGKSYGMLVFAVAFENFSGGMGTAAFVSLLMAMCNHRFTATQYALLSSLAALGRIFIGPTSGFLVEAVGWASFFFITALTALPGLGLLWWLRHEVWFYRFSFKRIEAISNAALGRPNFLADCCIFWNLSSSSRRASILNDKTGRLLQRMATPSSKKWSLFLSSCPGTGFTMTRTSPLAKASEDVSPPAFPKRTSEAPI
jgi:PAT family beta-lactamase induction signal transducer AmpG